MADNQRQVIRNEETIIAGEPEATVVNTSATTPGYVAPVAPVPGYVAPVAGTTVQATSADIPQGDRVVARNVSQAVIDPAADRAANVDWLSRAVWFIVGLMAILLAIRFILLATGANEAAGFAQLIYGVTGPLVAPFATLFGAITYPGAEQTGVIEWASLIAIVVYALIGWGITKVADLMLGTNRTSGTTYSDTNRRTRM